MKDTVAYIDGYNFFYAIKNHGRNDGSNNDICLAWCDFHKLITQHIMAKRPDILLTKIKYFTAKVPPNPKYSREKEAQKIWLDAACSIPLVEMRYGYFSNRPLYPKERQEKLTDVNIAVEIVWDVAQGDCDHVILITNDMDIQPAAAKIMGKASFELWTPPFTQPSGHWRSFCKEHHFPCNALSQEALLDSRLPDVIHYGNHLIVCPKYWQRKAA